MVTQNAFSKATKKVAEDFLTASNECVVHTENETGTAFADFNLIMWAGVCFRPSNSFRKLQLALAKSIASLVKENKTGVNEIHELITKSIAKYHSQGHNESFDAILYSSFLDYTENYANYLGPCQVFSFTEDCSQLSSSMIDIVNADEASKRLLNVANKSEVKIESTSKFEVSYESNKFLYTMGGLHWHIRCASPKELVREEAKWLADVFTSYFRITHRADFCHRSRLGQVEPEFNSEILYYDQFTKLYRDKASGISFKRYPTYKVTKHVADEFHSSENQKRLSEVLEGAKGSLAARVRDSLGWLSRARQASDISQRLLFNFTALEAILSQQDAFSPVAETISRMAGVILSDKIENRIQVYDDIKNLYGLRSDLVHRGQRRVNTFSADNLEHIAERCIATILHKCDLTVKHSEFMNDLKRHSHGTAWKIG